MAPSDMFLAGCYTLQMAHAQPCQTDNLRESESQRRKSPNLLVSLFDERVMLRYGKKLLGLEQTPYRQVGRGVFFRVESEGPGLSSFAVFQLFPQSHDKVHVSCSFFPPSWKRPPDFPSPERFSLFIIHCPAGHLAAITVTAQRKSSSTLMMSPPLLCQYSANILYGRNPL